MTTIRIEMTVFTARRLLALILTMPYSRLGWAENLRRKIEAELEASK